MRGVSYIFEEVEVSTVHTTTYIYSPISAGWDSNLPNTEQYANTNDQVSGWHLSKIVTPTGREFMYEYDTVQETFTQETFYSQGASSQTSFQTVDKLSATQRYEVATKQLQKITSDNFEVHVESEAREDLEGSKRLTELKILSKRDLTTPIKHWHFSYEYFIPIAGLDPAGSVFHVPNPFTNEQKYASQRLFLKEVYEDGSIAGQEKIPYSFEYFGENFYNGTYFIHLPIKQSKKQDFWGYYLEQLDEPVTLIPDIYVYPNETGYGRYRIYANGSGTPYLLKGHLNTNGLQNISRTPSVTSAPGGMLEKVNFPTGGFQTFSYELNEYMDPDDNKFYPGGGVRIKEIRIQEGNTSNPDVDMVREYKYLGGKLIKYPVFARETAYTRSPNVLNVPNLVVGSGLLLAPSQLTSFSDWELFTRRFTQSIAPLSDMSGASVIYTQVEVIQKGNPQTQEDNGKTVQIYYPPKTFRTHATPVQTTDGVFYGQIRYFINYYSPDPLLNIDEWSFYDSYYGESIGKNDVDPDFHWGAIQKSGGNIFPYPPLKEDLIEPYGKLKEEQVYKRLANGGYELVSKTKLTYEPNYLNSTGPVIVRGLVYGNHNTFDNRSNSTEGMSYRVAAPKAWASYEHLTGAGWITKVAEEWAYESNSSGNSIYTKQEFEYGSQNHPYLTRETTINSDNTEYFAQFFYPQDLGGTFAGTPPLEASVEGHNAMLDQRLLNAPIERRWGLKRTGTEEYLGGVFNTFKVAESGYVVPGEVWVSYLDQPKLVSQFQNGQLGQGGISLDPSYESEFVFSNYDKDTNVLDEKRTNSEPQSYIWASNHFLTTAITANAIYKDIAYSSFEGSIEPDPSNANKRIDGRWEFITPNNSGGGWSETDAKTGLFQYDLNDQYQLSTNIETGGEYFLSFWSKQTQPITFLHGLTATLIRTETAADGWILHMYKLSLSAGQQVSIQGAYSSNNYLDELRLHPIHARMGTVCYDKLLRIHTMTDQNNRSSFYQYDELSRLHQMRDHNKYLRSLNTYNYGN